jgi:hypothetical protein
VLVNRSLAASTLLALVALLIVAQSRQAATATRAFPDSSSRIAILTDQLPSDMSEAQVRFAATHYVGTQKLTLNLSRPLRAINPGFIVLHYRLAMWQSAPHVQYIVDGNRWSNDYPTVTRNESWFWHNPSGQRVASSEDGKLLMNIADPGFRAYWRESIARQVTDGEYDGVFLDSASPALLNWEARRPPDPRLDAKGARSNTFPELGGRSWTAAWNDWIADLDRFLAGRNIPLIPNVGALTTTWDDSDYTLTAGAFSEGFLDPAFVESDWRAAVEQTLALVRKNRIVILQNTLRSADDVARRKYLLANYLLVKGSRTYLAYFATTPLDWYPEWTLDLGTARTIPASVGDLAWRGVYRREFANGMVLINPGTSAARVQLDTAMRRIDPSGGGRVGRDGVPTGTVAATPVSSLELAPKSAEILLR